MLKFMEEAFLEAEKAAARGEVPIGAVLVSKDGEILAQNGNRTETAFDPTAHAEILVIRAAAQRKQSWRLLDCDLYVTLEPCAMCAAAISFARIRTVIYGASDPKGGGVEHGGRFFSQSTCHHRPVVQSGEEAGRSAELLRTFFAQRRKKSSD